MKCYGPNSHYKHDLKKKKKKKERKKQRRGLERRSAEQLTSTLTIELRRIANNVCSL
jgi:hypothetical protein